MLFLNPKSRTKTILISLIFSTITSLLNGQNDPFGLYIEPININGLTGVQSFAYGQSNGKWLIIGGRLDGLHRRQPFASFDIPGHNTSITVIDPIAGQKWTAPLSTLSISLQDQLSSTNPEFYQRGNILYYVGGYGYSNVSASRITYDKLTAIDVPAVINAVINGTDFTTHFRQITDSKFALTGGHLEMIDQSFYLVGGHKFDGNYNPMNGGSYTQVYSNAIRKFNLADDGINLNVSHFPEINDPTNLRRRDYNLVPQILPDGKEGLTAFSGVFQPTADLPFLNCVNIDSSSYQVNNAFAQYYNHYHCANTAIFDSLTNEMHSVFFGGIAQYFDSSGVLVQDNNVPFVKTIGRVTRTASGTMAEYKMPIDMPGYLGASSEFIPDLSVSMYPNNVIKLNNITQDTTSIGYILGGINSTAPNIFFINTGTQSTANSIVYRVFLIKNKTNTAISTLNKQSIESLHLQVYPNPNKGKLVIEFQLTTIKEVSLTIHDIQGKELSHEILNGTVQGENYFSKEIPGLMNGGIYFVTLQTNDEKSVQKIIINN